MALLFKYVFSREVPLFFFMCIGIPPICSCWYSCWHLWDATSEEYMYQS